MTLVSSSKLMYYPTQEYETYRILPLLFELNLVSENVKELLGTDVYRKLLQKEFSCKIRGVRINNIVYEYMINNMLYDHLKKCFFINKSSRENEKITILDPFAGEGKWLSTFKDILILKDNLHLIANELEKNRYLECINNKNIDEVYNESFENFDYPKNSISLLLFNPPYGETNGVRNVKHYLQMIIDKQILINNKHNKEDSRNGVIAMVIRKDDAVDIAHLLNKYFSVRSNYIYKFNDAEYKKYKQHVIIAELRKDPLRSAFEHQSLVNDYLSSLNKNQEYDLSLHKLGFYITYPTVNIEALKENYNKVKLLNEENRKTNINDKLWCWVKEETEIKGENEININMPLQPKIGEVANIIASGMINSEIKSNKGNHVVVGGVKKLKSSTKELVRDKDGEYRDKIISRKYNEPYVNLLIVEDGQYKIKELKASENNVVSENE